MKLPVSTIGKSGVSCPASEDNVFILFDYHTV